MLEDLTYIHGDISAKTLQGYLNGHYIIVTGHYVCIIRK